MKRGLLTPTPWNPPWIPKITLLGSILKELLNERFCVSLGATAAVVLGSCFLFVALSSQRPSLVEEKVFDLLGLERYKVSKEAAGI